VLSAKQPYAILDIGKNTAYKLLQSGDIKSIKIGKVYKKCLKEYITKFN